MSRLSHAEVSRCHPMRLRSPAFRVFLRGGFRPKETDRTEHDSSI
ncbi:hypothetical protein HMPREF1986_02408 [Oribacterium sp. oral taxon 078 str. F0263]|nr:hypothetical protein HMPREF1986_02408 [Oribacterium sp. oral taxon 078 str. F0263]